MLHRLGQLLKNLCIAVISLMLAVPSLAGQERQIEVNPEHTSQVVMFLIAQVSSSPFAFIRNAKEYSGIQAADHLRKKYAYFKSQIASPEDFIRLCASKSILSGKPYRVIMPEGTIPLENWLQTVLADYSKTHNNHR